MTAPTPAVRAVTRAEFEQRLATFCYARDEWMEVSSGRNLEWYDSSRAALLAAYDALATERDAARTEADEWRRAVEQAAP